MASTPLVFEAKTFILALVLPTMCTVLTVNSDLYEEKSLFTDLATRM